MSSLELPATITPEPDNTLLGHEKIPAFGSFRVADVVPTIRALIARQNKGVEELEADCPSDWSSLNEALTELTEPLSYAWGVVHHLLGVANTEELRQAEQAVQAEVVSCFLRLSQSEPLYQAHKALREGPGWASLGEAERRIIDAAIQSAEQAGIGLQGRQKARFAEIEQALAEASTNFSNNLLDATKAFSLVLTDKDDTKGLPPSLLAAAAQSARLAAQADAASSDSSSDQAGREATPENGPWRITLDGPVFVPFMEHSTRSDLREKLYRAFISRASEGARDNQPLIEKILQLREEKARLLGYENFAALSLSRKMAKEVPAVHDLLSKLRGASKESAQAEFDDLTAFARETTGDSNLTLRHWDVGFWAERLREARYAFTDEELRPYFPLEGVLDGLFGVAQRLFGVRIEAADGESATWNKDVRFFRVADEAGKPLAAFFLDPYTRPENKRGGAWMDTCLDRKKRAEGSVRLPVAYLICNQTPPVDGRPSLMTFSEVETLFHEFGHGLQHMLTTIDYIDAAGINNVEWDAVELPSQFMENWCYHRNTLLGFARHFETREPLPEGLFDKIVAARTYRAGSAFLRQIYFGSLDLELHDAYKPASADSVLGVQERVAAQNTVLPPLPEDRFLCGFGHIFAGGYAAGYYSYKWAEVLAADAFAAFEEAGLDNTEALAQVGRRFRDTVLSMGGARAPGAVFKDFRGRDPDTEPLLRTYGLTA